MLQRKLLIKPCNNFLISDLVALKQGFILLKPNNVEIKLVKGVAKWSFGLTKTSFCQDEARQ